MSFSDLPLIPSDETEVPEDLDVIAAEAAALAAAEPAEEQEESVRPFGRTPLFDFDAGRFVRAGIGVVWVSGLEAVAQWCLMTVHAARYAHPMVFTEEFGMEEPDSLIGEAADVEEALSDWGARLVDALLVHDRIVSVEDFQATFDARAGIVHIESFAVVTDAGEFTVEGLEVPVREDGEQDG